MRRFFKRERLGVLALELLARNALQRPCCTRPLLSANTCKRSPSFFFLNVFVESLYWVVLNQYTSITCRLPPALLALRAAHS
jgi:hypothetical protein